MRLLGWLTLIGLVGIAGMVVLALLPALTPASGHNIAQSGEWRTITYKDEWGEPAGKGAMSSWVAPDRRMSFPYGSVRARLMVEDCRDVFIRFTEAPNLVGGDVRDGYSAHTLRARWNDGTTFTVKADQKWGGKDLSFARGGVTVSRIKNNDTLAVALDWYREGSVVWRFPLDGASEALQNAGCR